MSDDKRSGLKINHPVERVGELVKMEGDEYVMVVLYKDGSAFIATMVDGNVDIASNRDIVPDPEDPTGYVFKKRVQPPKATDKIPPNKSNLATSNLMA